MSLSLEEGKAVARWMSRYPAGVPGGHWFRPGAGGDETNVWAERPVAVLRRYG